MSDPPDVFKIALGLDVHDRAALAQRLLASLEELSEEEAERLCADEAQRRLEEYRAGRAKAVPAEEVANKAERLFPMKPNSLAASLVGPVRFEELAHEEMRPSRPCAVDAGSHHGSLL